MTFRPAFSSSPHRLFSLATLLVLFLCACGTNNYSSGHASAGTPAADAGSPAYKDLADSATKALSLTTSAERDAATNSVKIFALLKDQDGTPIFFLNKYNFVVQLNPQTAPSTVKSSSITLTTESSDEQVVALVIDSSGSMATVDSSTGLTRIEAAKSAAKLYIENMADGDYAAIVNFSDTATTAQALTNDKELLTKAVDSLSATGATNFGAAISKAVEAVGSRPGKRAMILLTDGDDTVDTITGGPTAWLGNSKSTRYQGVLAAQKNDFRIYTVGLGADISSTGLADLMTFASETDGAYFAAPTTASLTIPFGETIPNEIAALPPMETYVLTFPNPYPPKTGQEFDVKFGISVSYQDANGTLNDYFTGSYPVP